MAALTALLGIGIVAFGPVLAWTPGLRAGAVGLLVALAVSLVSAWRRWSALATANLGLGAYVLFGGAAALPDTAIAGVVPTLETWRLLARLTYAAWRDLLTASLPATTFTGPTVVPYLATLGLGTLAYGLALRSSRYLLAVPAALGLLVVGILWGTRQAPYALLQGLAFGLVALAWASWRSQRRDSRPVDAIFHRTVAPRLLASRLAAVAGLLVLGLGAAAVLAPLATPESRHVLRDDVAPPLRLESYPSPLTRYRYLETQLKTQPLLTVEGLPDGARVRLATLDAYDGNVYRVDAASAGFQRAGERIDSTSGIDGPTTRVSVTVQGLDGTWLPTVGATHGVRFGGAAAAGQAQGLHYNPATGTALTTQGIGKGTTYVLDAYATPRPADAAVAAATPAVVALPDPERVPDVLRDVTTRVVGPATTPADQLARILSHLRAGYYANGVEGASRTGHTSERIATLLTEPALVGDEEQYAVAMALMARQQGLPARVVMGFVRRPGPGPDRVTFTGDDARVWVEVAYQGLGWVSYDPTPDRNRVPRMTVPQPKEEPKPQVLPPPEPPRESAPPPVKADESDRPQEPERSRSLLAEIAAVAALVVGGLLVILAPFLVIVAVKAVRRRRRRTSGSTADRVGQGWAEVRDRATDLGATLPAGHTRREMARAIDGLYPASGSVALAERVDAHVFGRGEPTEDDVRRLWAAVGQALAAVDASVSLRRRWWGRVSLRSLRRSRSTPGGLRARSATALPPRRPGGDRD